MSWYKHMYTKKFINYVGFKSTEKTILEVDFIISTLNLPARSKLLDLCCGYGRHSCLIAQKTDWKVTGLDLSADYIKIAKDNYSTLSNEYLLGDMRELNFDNQFDAVINMFTSFGFFKEDSENEKVLEAVNKSLKMDGKFLLDYENKFHFVYNDVYSKERTWEKIEDTKYILFENQYDVINEREIFKASIYKNGKQVDSFGYNIRLYSFPEIKALLNRNGFDVIDIWGDYRSHPYTVKSKRVILLAKKIKGKINEKNNHIIF